MKYSSFICEHTAEFVLVPKLTSLLKQRFNYVIPIFPWLSREGGNLAKHVHASDAFKIIGLYPKRPKINLSDGNILLKINEEFITGAIMAAKVDIPMILGCPKVKTIWDLDIDTECIWVNLLMSSEQEYIFEQGSKRAQYTGSNKVEFINDDQIHKLIEEKSKEMSYSSFISSLRAIRSDNPRQYFMGYASYRPVYFILKN